LVLKKSPSAYLVLKKSTLKHQISMLPAHLNCARVALVLHLSCLLMLTSSAYYTLVLCLLGIMLHALHLDLLLQSRFDMMPVVTSAKNILLGQVECAVTCKATRTIRSAAHKR
jgi:hypothetical protein